MRLECFSKMCPGEPGTFREHGHVIVPPGTCGTPELLGCKSCLVPIIVRVQSELGLNGPEPAICFQWLICFVEQWWLSVQKLLISRNSRLVVMLMPLRSALLHNLSKECHLLVSSGEHGRNGLGQIRRVRWARHSAFNHDWISYMILDYKIIHHGRMQKV